MRWVVDSPRPVPLPGGLVVKNASKILCWTSSGMPGPLSVTSTTTSSSVDHTARCRVGTDGWPSVRPTSLRTLPPASASAALSIRFVHTWLRSPPTAVIGRERVLVVTVDADASELVGEQHQRRLETVDHVDVLDRCPVQVCVALERSHDVRQPPAASTIPRTRACTSLAVAASANASSRNSEETGAVSGVPRHDRSGRSDPRPATRADHAVVRRRARHRPAGARLHASCDAVVVEQVGDLRPRGHCGRAHAATAWRPLRRPRRPPSRPPPVHGRRRAQARAVVGQVVESFEQAARGALHRGGRIVEFVRDPGGERAELSHPLVVAQLLGGVVHARDQPAEHRPRRVGARRQQVVEGRPWGSRRAAPRRGP
jgi:hypothetical protein